MTWEWSHTPEAYEAARLNLFNMEPETLREIFAEWRGYLCDPEANGSEMCPHCYADAQAEAKRLTVEELAPAIWEHAADWTHGRSCTNGGFEAHMCPYGCGCHMVPFDTEALDEAAE